MFRTPSSRTRAHTEQVVVAPSKHILLVLSVLRSVEGSLVSHRDHKATEQENKRKIKGQGITKSSHTEAGMGREAMARQV